MAHIKNSNNLDVKYKFGATNILITKPKDPDSILQEIDDAIFNKDEFMPYWAHLWPTSFALLSYLEKTDFTNIEYSLELGSGLGVISCALALKGVNSIATDICFNGCSFINHNFSQNNIQKLACCMDWRNLSFKNSFPLIIGCDILYEERWVKPIIKCLKDYLSNNGYAIIADPNRKYLTNFKNSLPEYALTIKEIHTFENLHSINKIEIITIVKK